MELRSRIQFLMAFRVCSLSVMLGSGLILQLFYSEPFSHELVVLLIAGFGFTFLFAPGLWMENTKALRILAQVQILWDLLFTTVLVQDTGGIRSAFILLYGVHILMASAVLMVYGALAASGVSAVLLAASSFWKDWSSLLQDPPSVSRLIGTCSFLVLIGALIAYLFKNRGELLRSLEKTTADLLELSRLHSTILDHISTGILYADTSTKVIWMNRAALKILGASFEGIELKGSELDCFLRPQGRFESKVILRVMGEKFIGHHIADLPDGGRVVVFQDVSEIRELEERVQLSQKLAAVGQLAAGIAHEIRTPLASISGSIQLLQSEMELNDDIKKLMTIVLRETDRLDDLAKNFLDYARPSKLQLESVNLYDLFQDIKVLVENLPHFKSHHITLVTEIPVDLVCLGDPRQLKQILWNLLKNAVEATAQNGKVLLKSSLVSKDNSEKVLISVVDSGAGISEDLRQKIFEPFFSTKLSGTGLGLPLVYEMVKAHGGTIGFESRVGEGTNFWIELPLNLKFKDGESLVKAA